MKTIIALLFAFALPFTAAGEQSNKFCLRDQNDASLFLFIDTGAKRWALTSDGRPRWEGSGLTVNQSGVTLAVNYDRPEIGEALAVEADLYERRHRALLRPGNSTGLQFYGELYTVTTEADCACQR